MKKITKFLPIIILVFSIAVGAFFRFYEIGQSPSGFYVDEASIGYNAFSILKTGKDEYGKFMPVLFRSFATFQSPIYSYLLVPIIPILGLTPLSVRFPSALLGVLSIALIYLLIRKITPRKYSTQLASISALFLAISPWHIQYSRTAYETNVALFFLILGSLLFYYSIKRPWLFILSAISFAVSFNAYRAETLIVPVLVFVLSLRFRKKILTETKLYLTPLLISLVVGIIIITPTILIMKTPGFQARSSELNILSTARHFPWGYKTENPISFPLINNLQLLTAREFISLYSSYFSPRYMFSLGDSGPRKPYPDLGTFFVWQFPLYLVGLYYLLKEKDLGNLRYFTFILLLISPVSAALTRDPYSTIRSLPMVIPLILIVSFGLVKILNISWPQIKRWKYLIVCLLITYSSIKMYISIFYLNDYFRSEYWNYGWQEALSNIPNLDQELPVVIDNSRGDSYIQLLFFLNYDPATYQRDNSEIPLSEYYTNLNRNTTKHIGRFTVKKFQWGVDTDHINQYIIADDITIGMVQIQEHGLAIVDEIRQPNGNIALRILKTNPKK